ncbi:MAG: TetR/AcrR family transcriptional regulator [Rhodococcus sp.]|nr:TetR/AcrR family transcriptional regulator [Rhodococcus sp. (in: high G+C Gram-positive bacteria)]
MSESDANNQVKRVYRSPLREDAARRTRETIRSAAAELFRERGYVGTTVRLVAERAGVAVRTVSAVFPGGKAELFHSALESASALPQILFDAPRDPSRDDADFVLDHLVWQATEIHENIGRLVLAAVESSGADEDMARFSAEHGLDTAANAMTIAEGLASNGMLRHDVTVQYAADVLYTVVSPQVHDLLRRQCNWDTVAYRNWVKATIRSGLLG